MTNKQKKLVIKCPACKMKVAEPTENFNPDVRPNGSMLRLIEPYLSRGWSRAMGWNAGVLCSSILCPQCGNGLAYTGRFTLVNADEGRPKTQAEKNQEIIEKEFKLEEADISDNLLISDDIDISISHPEPEAAIEEQCPICGKGESEFKSRAGFKLHCRQCQKYRKTKKHRKHRK